MSRLANRRIFSGVLIFILLIAGIILSAQPTPARSDDGPPGRLLESDDPLVQRAGSWTKQAAAGASGGSYLYSGKSVDDVLTLEFVGPRIEIIYVQNPALGALAIEVDGTVLRTVMTDGTTPQFDNRAIVDYLENGPHTLKVYPQEGTIIGVDAFYIPAAPPVEPAPTVTTPTDSTPIPRGVNTSKLDEPVIAAAQAEGQIRVIVQLRAPSIGFGRAPFSPRLNLEIQNEVLANAGKFELRHKYSHLPAFAGYADLATLVQLQANPLVESIVIDEPSTMHTGQSVPAIQADIARNTYGLRGRGVTIAVLDTGIDTNHPDLSDDIIAQHCETQGNCPPSNTTSGVSAEDANGHGTNVSGIITANGVVTQIGFAPDAKIVAVRVLSSTGSGFVSDWVDGLNWIIANQAILNVDIINMSLGTNALYTSTAACDLAQPTVEDATTALTTAGVTIFASSGNQGSATSLSSPSCNTGVVSVGATYDSDLGREPDAGTYNSLFGGTWPLCFDAATNTTTITCFSNSNAELDLLAPGAQITSAGMGGGTSTFRGTSQASPTAAAVAALMLEANPTLTPAQIQSTLYSTGVNVTDSKNGFIFRRINALSAIQAVLPDEAAGAPSNDLFGNAVIVSSLPYRRNQEIYQATTTVTDPSGAAICNVTAADTVWYRYTPGVSQTVSVSTEGSTYDTVVGVYTGTEGALTLVGCNDDIDGIHAIRTSAVNFSATGGTTYRIMIAKYGTASTGTNVLRLSVSNTPVGDTLAVFNNSLNYAGLIDTLQNSPPPVNYANYPTGFGQTGGQWVMGDWNGDGQRTPGVYAPNGVFYYTNNIGFTGTWTNGFWIGLYGRPVVVGKFSGAANDCVGAVDSGNYPGYGTAFALYYTCNYAGLPNPPLTFQWLSIVLGDYAGFAGLGDHQFAAGDWNNDGLDSIAVRRGPFIAFTNVVPGTGHAAFDLAQYIGAPSALDYGLFVAGDWDSNRFDSFGLVYGNGDFYRRDNLEWNTGPNIYQYVGQPIGTINSVSSWHQR